MTFRAKVAIAFSAALLILVCIGVLSYQRMLQEGEDEIWVAHSHLVLETMATISSDLEDAMASHRAYILTGDSSYLEVYRSAVNRLQRDVRNVADLIADNSKQRQLLSELQPEITSRIAELQRILDVRDHRGLDAAIALIEQEHARKNPNPVRTLIANMRDEDNRLLRERVAAANAESRRTKIAIVVGNLTALGLLLTAGLFTLQEMDKRKRAEETLRESEERFRLLVTSVRDYSILMLDPGGRVASWSVAAERMYGFQPDEILGQHASVFFPPEEGGNDKAGWQLQVAEEKGWFEDENWRVRKDGSRFWASVVITALRDDTGKLRGFGEVTRDMTERRQSEQEILQRSAELSAANKELEAFCYSVSHDLRAPLRGINGFSLALLEDYSDRLDDTGKDYLQRVRAGTQRMGALIDDLLNLSRVTRSKMRAEAIDLSAMAASVATELSKAEPDRRVDFVIAPDLHAQGDPLLVRVVLENLLGNSWKFTSKRESARIELGEVGENGRSAFFVRDNGAGFDPTYSDRLFGVFQRLHANSDFPGTGVGLATVQRIVLRHGGRVWAESKPDQGATFFFTLKVG